MAEIYLICEGKADSLDISVLDAIIAQRYGIDVQIYPACGDASLKSVAEHYRERGGAYAFTIQDRNYRPHKEAENSWKSGKPHLIWRRHEIENYLLEPSVISQALKNIKKTIVTTKWDQNI